MLSFFAIAFNMRINMKWNNVSSNAEPRKRYEKTVTLGLLVFFCCMIGLSIKKEKSFHRFSFKFKLELQTHIAVKMSFFDTFIWSVWNYKGNYGKIRVIWYKRISSHSSYKTYVRLKHLSPNLATFVKKTCQLKCWLNHNVKYSTQVQCKKKRNQIISNNSTISW